MAGGDATDSQALASKARRGPVHAGAVDSQPAAEDAAGPSGRAAAPPLDADSPDDTAQAVRSAEAARPDAPTEPAEVAGTPHCAGEPPVNLFWHDMDLGGLMTYFVVAAVCESLAVDVFVGLVYCLGLHGIVMVATYSHLVGNCLA